MIEDYPGERYAGTAEYWEDMSFDEWVGGLRPDALAIWLMVFCDVEINGSPTGKLSFYGPDHMRRSIVDAMAASATEIWTFLIYELPEDLADEFHD